MGEVMVAKELFRELILKNNITGEDLNGLLEKVSFELIEDGKSSLMDEAYTVWNEFWKMYHYKSAQSVPEVNEYTLENCISLFDGDISMSEMSSYDAYYIIVGVARFLDDFITAPWLEKAVEKFGKRMDPEKPKWDAVDDAWLKIDECLKLKKDSKPAAEEDTAETAEPEASEETIEEEAIEEVAEAVEATEDEVQEESAAEEAEPVEESEVVEEAETEAEEVAEEVAEAEEPEVVEEVAEIEEPEAAEEVVEAEEPEAAEEVAEAEEPEAVDEIAEIEEPEVAEEEVEAEEPEAAEEVVEAEEPVATEDAAEIEEPVAAEEAAEAEEPEAAEEVETEKEKIDDPLQEEIMDGLTLEELLKEISELDAKMNSEEKADVKEAETEEAEQQTEEKPAEEQAPEHEAAEDELVKARHQAGEILDNALDEAEAILNKATEREEEIVFEANQRADEIIRSAQAQAEEQYRLIIEDARKKGQEEYNRIVAGAEGAVKHSDEYMYLKNEFDKVAGIMNNIGLAINEMDGKFGAAVETERTEDTEKIFGQFFDLYAMIADIRYVYSNRGLLNGDLESILYSLESFMSMIEEYLESYNIKTIHTNAGEPFNTLIHEDKEGNDFDVMTATIAKSVRGGFCKDNIVLKKEQVVLGNGEVKSGRVFLKGFGDILESENRHEQGN